MQHVCRLLTGHSSSLHLQTDGLLVLFGNLHDLILQQLLLAKVRDLIGGSVLSALSDTPVLLLFGLAKIPIVPLNSVWLQAVWAKSCSYGTLWLLNK